jgi:glycosyltransferase involved in cell wall biosynthesis
MDYPNNNIVLPPPCDYRKWDDGLDHYDAKYITLVNHNVNKGGNVLIRLAKLMPDRKFLAVAGSYDTQVMDRTLPNVKYMPQTQDMKAVYRDSRIVIMPSQYESYGLVFNEAGASGIPVLMHPTDGLKENAGDAGIYCDRGREEEWVEAIKKLDDKKYYKEVSDKVRARTREQDPYKNLEQFESFVHGVWKQYHKQ